MPGYQVYGLVIAWLKEDKTEEGLQQIDTALAESDLIPHPFQAYIQAVADTVAGSSKRSKIDNVIYDDRLTDLPIEVQKKKEAEEQGKMFRVPEWWRGEQANYKIARSMMGTIPKNIGPINK